MTSSMINPSTKSKRGRPPVDSEQVGIRVERPVINALDAYSADQPDTPGRPEAIRRLLRDGLTQRGYLDGKAGGRAGVRLRDRS